MSDDDSSTTSQATGLLDLSRQQRNLLLMRPVFLLERDKMKVGDDGAGERVFAGIDTHYLALSALDLMMEATTISSGSTSQEVLSHLAEIAGLMNPALTIVQARRIGEVDFRCDVANTASDGQGHECATCICDRYPGPERYRRI